jgi:hypothetical protein
MKGIQKKVEQIGSTIMGAVTLPGDVLAGKVDPLSEEGIQRAADLSQIMTSTPGGAGGLGSGARRPFRHATEEARQASIEESKAASISRYRADNAETRAKIKDQPFVDDVNSKSWDARREIDGLINKGKLTETEEARLKFLLNQRYEQKT